MSPYPLPFHGWLGLVALVLGHIALFSGVESVRYWFFPLAWWPYILVVDALVYRRRGGSLLISHPREFLLLVPWSICLWLTFELFNVVLDNWHYVEVPGNLLERWGGYAVCYATVLPGLFETVQFLDAFGFLQGHRLRRLPATTRWYLPFVITGLFFLILPLVLPRLFFPLVWGCFIFLLEPINHRFGGHSLMRRWEQGTLRTFFLLLAAGAVCGFLWEFWNFWALTKWVYTVPYVGFLKIFEMPLLGFLGFPPFAVECYVMMNTVSLFRGNRSWEDPQPARGQTRRVRTALIGLALLAYSLFVFHQIDLHTLASYRP